MNFGISMRKPLFNVMVEAPEDPFEGIRDLLPKIGGTFGCPQCCSATDVWFSLKGEEWGRSQVFSPKRFTKLDDTWTLAEGANGGIVNIGDLVPGQTVDFEPGGRNAFVLMGSEKAMNDMSSIMAGIELLRESQQWKENGKFVDAIGVLRTNDPLITGLDPKNP